MVAGEAGGRRFVVAVDAAAEQAGITPGMPLASAQAIVPSIVTVARDPARDRALVRRLARWSERYTPLVAIDGSDGLLLDVTGSAHLFGGEAALIAGITARLGAFGLSARTALAATAGAARALARWGAAGTILAEGDTAAGIAALPIEALGLDSETTADLLRLGLKRIGDLYPLPRAALAHRFGASLLDCLDRTLGRIAQPLSPERFAAPWRQRIPFAEPVGDRARLARAVEDGLARLCRRLREEARGARRLRCTFERLGAPPQAADIGTARPVRDPRHLARLFAGPLETLSAGDGVEAVIVEVLRTEPLPPEQTHAAMQAPAMRPDTGVSQPSAGAAGEARLADLLDRLGNRLGFDRVVCFRPLASHLPECAYAAVPAGAASIPTAWPAPPVPRPIRLLATPEPIEVLAHRAQDGEPADDAAPPALFRRRSTRHRETQRGTHQVTVAIGPERISWAWWRDDPDWRASQRDYWRIEDADGRRFWLFRRLPDGETDLAANETGAEEEDEATSPAWFLHGFFA